MAQASSLRHLDLHGWKRFDTLVPLHIHLPTSHGQYLEIKDFWWIALHGSPQDGRNVDMGHLRKPIYRRLDPSDPFHHRSEDDERSCKVSFSSISGLYLQPRVSCIQASQKQHLLTCAQCHCHWRC
jgi:hypothetical protein